MKAEKLTDAEFTIMQIMWGCSEPMMMGEILDRVNRGYAKDWKPQTISTYISRLLQKGFLKKDREERFAHYTAAIDFETYKNMEIEAFAKKWGGGSLTQFAAAFNKSQPITDEQKNELREFLDGLD